MVGGKKTIEYNPVLGSRPGCSKEKTIFRKKWTTNKKHMTTDRKIVWWNTGVAPPIFPTKKNPVISGKRTIAEAVSILNGIDHSECDLVFLAEIDNNELASNEMKSFALNNGYVAESYYKIDGRMKWDIAILYKPESFAITEFSYLTEGSFSSNRKLAIKVDSIYHNTPVRFMLSHFPGRHLKDSEKAKMLLDLIQYSKASYNNNIPHSVIIGDFNIELCSPHIINYVSRSRRICLKNGTPYAPMFKHLGEKYALSSNKEISGTLLLSDSWQMFDFALFSKHFLNSSSAIQIDDQQCGIWDDLISPQKVEIDHLPIYFTIKRT